MAQLNLNVTPDFESDLRRLMKLKGIRQKSEAVRLAVKEAASRSAVPEDYDYRAWLGMGLKAPLNAKPRFRGEDDLWS